MNGRRCTLLAPATLLAAPVVRAQAGWCARYRKLRLGISSAENAHDAVARRQPFQGCIQRTLGVPLRVFHSTDYAGVL
jgi:ABC-type phosphate/phosphonate transport system substrate-binding protein